ncbi:MAG: ATPase [Marinilabiliales bacterium]
MTGNYQTLINKLDDFIRKFYRNEIIKGIILSSSIILIAWTLIAILEYLGHYSILIRTIIFYTTLIISIAIIIKFIIYPLLQFLKIGKRINHKQASEIISKHFTEIKDKLINTLELGEMHNNSGFSQELLFASIEQKTNELKPIPFPKAINTKVNIRYLRIFFSVVLLITIILVTSPRVLTEGTVRIIKHNTYFEPKQPFKFELLNNSLNVEKGKDIEIVVNITGKYVPENAFIVIGGNNFLMQRKSKAKYVYKIKNINNDIRFHFLAEDIRSEDFQLKVLPTPAIIDFKVYTQPPAYTNEKNKILDNIGDITVPEGSVVKWVFQTSVTDNVYLEFNDSIIVTAKNESNVFTFDSVFTKSAQYTISLKNKYFTKDKIINYQINTIPDMYPGIGVSVYRDSSIQTIHYFQGKINDDYGLKKLCFIYYFEDNKDSSTIVTIPINQELSAQEFYFAFDFGELNIAEDNSVKYYFEVWDNDAIHGSKSTKSSVYEYIRPSKEELEKLESESEKSIEEKLNESKNLVNKLKKDIAELQENMINRDLSSWEKTKALQNISQKQNQLEQLLDEINNINTEKNNYLNSYFEPKEELLEKQKQIEEMLENLMDEEMKKMLEELNELMKNFDKKELDKLTEKMSMSYEDLEKQLDKNLEVLKRFEVEKEIENTIDKLSELAEKQEELSKETKENKGDKEELLQKQQEQSEEFQKAMEDYKKALEKNKELEHPMKLQDFEQDKEKISNEFEQGSQELQKNNKNKAAKSQQQNSENLKNMAASMQGMMQQNSLQQNTENIDDLKQILENLVTFSFDQEELMKKFDKTTINDPKYMQLTTEQKKLEDNFSIIRDSLNALGKRTPMLGNAIDKEIRSIERDMQKALELLEETRSNNIKAAQSRQQFIMTSANNLALLLSEIMQQMQQQAMSQCQGNGNCSKPGNGKPSLSDMKGQQQSLKQQLESLLQQLKEGSKPGNQKSISKQLAKMLAQQEIFQNELSKLMNSGGIHPEMMRLLNEIKRLSEDVEKDIINKNITPETLKRQEQILTRMLEAENSDFQREIDNKRKSEEAKNKKISNPKDFFKYKRLHQNYNELLNTSDIKMYKFYNEKYKQYLMNLNENE